MSIILNIMPKAGESGGVWFAWEIIHGRGMILFAAHILSTNIIPPLYLVNP